MTSVIQSDFSGGMNLFDEPVNIADNQYAKGFNVRARTSGLSSVLGPEQDINAPLGKKQGIYAFDKYMVIFVSGFAFYKNILTDSTWTQIANFVLDPLVDYIYVLAVPISTNNYVRKLVNSDQVSGVQGSSSPINLTVIQDQGSNGGLICQDGINQPWLILSDGTARRLNTYDQWTQAFHGITNPREYVPIMKQMIMVQGIVLGVAPDGNTLLRSVSGRPLDFVIDVDTEGKKGSDAYSNAYNVNSLQITCLTTLATGEILVGTEKTCDVIVMDFTNTIFAEPTFDIIKTYTVGIVNQFSFFKMLRPDGFSYHYFIDKDGFRTFGSGTVFDDNENRNQDFSILASPVIGEQKQVNTCLASFNNYILFSVSSDTFGDVVVVYDSFRQKWVSLDLYNIGKVKMFAVADQSDDPVLYCISNDNVYRLFVGDPLSSSVYLKAFSSGFGNNSLLNCINCVMVDATEAGIVTASDVLNGVERNNVRATLHGRAVETVHLDLQKLSKQAWSIQPSIAWDNDARVIMVESKFTVQTQNTPIQQQLDTK